jgi:putative transposase
LVEEGHPRLSLARQCELLGLARSTFYYEPSGQDDLNLLLMRLIDEQYTRTPFYGSPKMTHWLRREGWAVNHKRVERLMREMGLQAALPRRNLSQSRKEHRKYPYLLGGMNIERPNQVWCSDITYVRMARGFVYLAAVMDWFSRYVLSWELSGSLDSTFCVDALKAALRQGRPEVFNTDQGSQFTSEEFTDCLLSSGVRISMDGRGRCFDNIFIERLWRTVKYEEVYLKDYEDARQAARSLGAYLGFYNEERLHESLGYRVPQEAHFGESGKPLYEFGCAAGRLVRG